MNIDCGTVVLVELDPTLGHEQRGVRPCVVVSDPAVNADQRLRRNWSSYLHTVGKVTTPRAGYGARRISRPSALTRRSINLHHRRRNGKFLALARRFDDPCVRLYSSRSTALASSCRRVDMCWIISWIRSNLVGPLCRYDNVELLFARVGFTDEGGGYITIRTQAPQELENTPEYSPLRHKAALGGWQ